MYLWVFKMNWAKLTESPREKYLKSMINLKELRSIIYKVYYEKNQYTKSKLNNE